MTLRKVRRTPSWTQRSILKPRDISHYKMKFDIQNVLHRLPDIYLTPRVLCAYA